METSERIVGLIANLSYPILVFEKLNDEWSFLYQNKKMSTLSGTVSEEDKSEDQKEPIKKSIPISPIENVLKEYTSKSSVGTYTIHNFEIFDSIYNINFDQQENTLFVLFVEINMQNLVDLLPLQEFKGVCNSIVVVLNMSGEIVDTNECFCTLIAADKKSLEGKNFFQNFVPGNLEKLNHYLEDVCTHDDHHQHFITPLRSLDEQTYRINWNVSKILLHEQTHIIAVGSDISKFLQENSELKKQLTSIKVGFEYFPFGVAYMNDEGMFTNMNSRFMQMFSITESNKKLNFDDILLFKNHIGFIKMKEYITLIKEMSYQIDHKHKEKSFKVKVDIRLLSGKKDSSKLYIVVVQKTKQ